MRWALAVSLAALAGACVPEEGVPPCTDQGLCLVGFECVAGFCLQCVEGTCGGLKTDQIGPAGGMLCGPDEACIEILPGALANTATIGIRRSNKVAPPLDVRSIVYEISPVNTRLEVPARVSIPISPSDRLEDVRVFVAAGTSDAYAPLPGAPTPTYAIGSTDRLGSFVAIRLPE